jgi:putative ABC transport system permease protein
MITLIKMSFRNVAKNWRHSLAAVLSVTAGFIAQVLFSGYIAKVETLYDVSYSQRGMYGDILLENKGMLSAEAKAEPFKYYLTKNEQTLIEEFLNQNSSLVHSQVRFLQLQGMITNGKANTIFWGQAYDAPQAAKTRGPIWKWNTLYGVPLQETSSLYPLLVGQGLGRILSCEPVSKYSGFNALTGYEAIERPFDCKNPQMQVSLLTEDGQMNALDVDLVGIIDSGYRDLDLRYIHTTLPTAQLLLNTDKITFYTIQLHDRKNIDRFISEFNLYTERFNPEIKAFRWQDHVVGELYRSTMQLLTIFKVFVITVILSITCLSVLNTMVKIVKERTREIGTLRSLGFVRKQIITLFAFEAVFLSLLGVSIGIILAIGLTFLFNHSGITYKAGIMSEPIPFWIEIQINQYLMSLGLLVFLSVMASYFASRGPTKKPVAQNLSYA